LHFCNVFDFENTRVVWFPGRYPGFVFWLQCRLVVLVVVVGRRSGRVVIGQPLTWWWWWSSFSLYPMYQGSRKSDFSTSPLIVWPLVAAAIFALRNNARSTSTVVFVFSVVLSMLFFRCNIHNVF
jgi:hypothetical protein